MPVLIIGLFLFLAIHSVKMLAPDWRERQIEKMGEQRWKGIYSLASAVTLSLAIWGFAFAREGAEPLYVAPMWLRHVAIFLTAIAFVLFVAAYVPNNILKAKIGHPMLAGVKTWAFAHLLVNGRVPDLILFGGFLMWSGIDFVKSRKRDREQGVSYPPANPRGTAISIVAGLAAWAIFAYFLHGWLIGVRPLG